MADPLNRGPVGGPSTLRQELSVILAPRNGLVICALASATLLLGAFLFEHVGGMAPCSLCIWQRWAHLGVIAAATSGLLFIPPRTALLLSLVAALISFGVAGFHAGVEWQLWKGAAGCTASELFAIGYSATELRAAGFSCAALRDVGIRASHSATHTPHLTTRPHHVASPHRLTNRAPKLSHCSPTVVPL